MNIPPRKPTDARSPAYRIQTERLVLRCWEPGDAQLLKEAIDASLQDLLPWMPWAHSEPEPLQIKIDRLRHFRGQFDLGQDFIYAIFNQDETQVLGGSGLHTRAGENAREIGYWIHADYVGRGLATETTAALTKVAFEIDRIERLEIHCDPENELSASIPRKLGLNLDGVIRRSTPFLHGELRDTMIWTLLKEEYADSPAASAELEAFDVIGRKLL
jgi:RimJ/RimL family protein N-acetyltransferase